MESKYYHLTGGTHSFLVLHDLLNPSEEFPIHTQSDWELIYIIRGCGTFVIGDQSQPFTKDEIFLIPPDMLHGWIFDNNPGNVVEDICLLFRKNLFQRTLGYITRNRAARTPRQPATHGLSITRRFIEKCEA